MNDGSTENRKKNERSIQNQRSTSSSPTSSSCSKKGTLKIKDRRSQRHIRYQTRLANILRQCGFKSVKTEQRLPYYLPLRNGEKLKIRYRVDVYGKMRDRAVAIEVDGFMGHKSWRAYAMDELRSRRLCEAYAPIEIYRFTFKQLAKWTDEEIAQEMKL